jgi:hypothetical protein
MSRLLDSDACYLGRLNNGANYDLWVPTSTTFAY